MRRVAGRVLAAAVLAALIVTFGVTAADPVYTDKERGFRIRSPEGWVRTTKGPFLVQFYEPNYQAFIIVDRVETDGEVTVDAEFKKFISAKNEEVRRSNSTFKVLANGEAKIGSFAGYITQATFQAGGTRIRMDIYYIPAGNRIYMISTACADDQLGTWQDQFFMSLGSFGELK